MFENLLQPVWVCVVGKTFDIYHTDIQVEGHKISIIHSFIAQWTSAPPPFRFPVLCRQCTSTFPPHRVYSHQRKNDHRSNERVESNVKEDELLLYYTVHFVCPTVKMMAMSSQRNELKTRVSLASRTQPLIGCIDPGGEMCQDLTKSNFTVTMWGLSFRYKWLHLSPSFDWTEEDTHVP